MQSILKFDQRLDFVETDSLNVYSSRWKEELSQCSKRNKRRSYIIDNALRAYVLPFSDFLNYWKQTWNWRYGNCYTFNSGASNDGKKIPVLTSTKPGPKYGKTLWRPNRT